MTHSAGMPSAVERGTSLGSSRATRVTSAIVTLRRRSIASGTRDEHYRAKAGVAGQLCPPDFTASHELPPGGVRRFSG